MKLILWAFFLSSPFGTLSQSDSVYIEFANDIDEYPNCKTVFAANGHYQLSNPKLPQLEIPYTLQIIPKNLTRNGKLTSYSNRVQLSKLGSYDYPTTFYEVLTYHEVKTKNPFDRDGYVWLPDDPIELAKKGYILVPEEHYDALGIQNKFEVEYHPESGIIDGVFISEHYFYHRIPFFEVYPKELDFLDTVHASIQQEVQLSIDSVFAPFYFSQFEVTNYEYRQFVDYVRDSIALNMAYTTIEDDDLAATLLNATKKEKKSLNLANRSENAKLYGLKKTKRFYNDPALIPYLSYIYHPQPERYYHRREIDTRKLFYKINSTDSIHVYPDTNNFHGVFDQWVAGDVMANMYFWHPAYDNYPLVNVNKAQILAFCHWKEVHINRKYGNDSIYIHVSPPSILQYEMAAKSQVSLGQRSQVVDQQNSKYVAYQRSAEPSFLNLKKVFADNVKPSKAPKRGRRYFLRRIFRLRGSKKIKFLNDSLISSLDGNVSEMVIDKVTKEKATFYGIEAENIENTHFVLGSNYHKNALIIGDDNYNSIFYKTIRKNDKSDCLTGFRLVYTIEKLE